MKSILGTIITLLLISSSISAQVVSDALIFSETNPNITARSAATGNSLGALGGDLSALSTNPAGLGIYRSTEISFSPGLSFNNVQTTFGQDTFGIEKSRTQRSNFLFGSVGAVFSKKLHSDWKSINFGFGLNRLADFGRSFKFDAVTYGSRLVTIGENANGKTLDQLNDFEEGLAYDTYLMDLDYNTSDQYVTALTDDNYVRKSQTVRQSGGINEFAMSIAANYDHKLYIGFTLGIDFLTLVDNRKYQELEETNTIDFLEMRFDEYRTVNGVGANLKLGFIYRINKMFRVGFAAHTPTWFSLREKYNTTMAGRVYYNGDLQDTEFTSPEAKYKHNFNTPAALSLSFGSVFGKRGFLGVEAEYVDYTWSNFSLSGNDTNIDDERYIDNINEGIDNLYKGVFRARIGGELVFDLFRVRAGYRIQTSPYQESVAGVSDLRHDISAGIGIRMEHFYIDMAYVHNLKQFEYIPYTSYSILQQVKGKASVASVLLTAGVRF
ncbi:MAG: aromatic hydrocarbon degradation protein [Aureispira sp.]|nr:aromatic hydrocarbon degradation protein [Aureispira sp.]